jgi:hypothetical protein
MITTITATMARGYTTERTVCQWDRPIDPVLRKSSERRLVDNVRAAVYLNCLARNELCPVHADKGDRDSNILNRN